MGGKKKLADAPAGIGHNGGPPLDDDAGETTRPAIAERGELELDLGGEKLTLRPTYEAIEGFELATGKGLVTLATEALARQLRLGEVAQIVCECVRAWGQATGHSAKGSSATKIGKLILDSNAGVMGVMGPVSGMLALATTGGYDSSGKLKAATTGTTTTPPGTGAA